MMIIGLKMIVLVFVSSISIVFAESYINSHPYPYHTQLDTVQRYKKESELHYNCPILDSLTNGNIVTSKLNGEHKAYHSCKRGYILNGNKIRTCRNSKWSGTEPVCIAVDCGTPHNPDPFGSMQIKTTTFLDVVAFQCNDGYHFDTTKGGSEIVVCRADGTWSNKPPTCKYTTDCGKVPPPENGYVKLTSSNNFGSEAQFTCKKGFKLIGTSTRRCQNNGRWSFHQPSCQEINCAKLNVSNGLTHVSGYSVGDYAFFKCYSERYYKGRKYRLVCLNDGTWSGLIPQCGHISDQYHINKNK